MYSCLQKTFANLPKTFKFYARTVFNSGLGGSFNRKKQTFKTDSR